MRRSTVATAAMCLAVAAAAQPLSAECFGHASLEQVVRRSDLIFVGTVQAITSMRLHLNEPESPEGTVMTRYRFRQNRYIKGSGSPDSLSLIRDGGSDGGLLYVSDAEIRLELGKRYVIFAAHDPRPRLHGEYRALLCVDHYTIDADSSGWSVGLLSSGEMRRDCRLVVFDTRHMVWTMDREWDARSELPPPPRYPLPELLRVADSTEAAQVAALRTSVSDSALFRERVHDVWIYPHQDPGTRVTEQQFVDTMRVIVDRISLSRSHPASH